MLKVGFSESTMFKESSPLWGQKIRANESRGQTCLDYAKCSRIWRNSENRVAIFTGDWTMLGACAASTAGAIAQAPARSAGGVAV